MFRQEDLLVFPRLVFEQRGSKNENVYSLDWPKFIEESTKRRQYYANKGGTATNVTSRLVRSPLSISDKLLNDLNGMRFMLNDHVLNEIRRNVRRAVDEWNQPRHVDAFLVKRLLAPAIEYICCSFYLLTDCLWDTLTKRWDKKGKKEAESLMLTAFWGNLVGYPEAGGQIIPFVVGQEHCEAVLDVFAQVCQYLPEHIAEVVRRASMRRDARLKYLEERITRQFTCLEGDPEATFISKKDEWRHMRDRLRINRKRIIARERGILPDVDYDDKLVDAIVSDDEVPAPGFPEVPTLALDQPAETITDFFAGPITISEEERQWREDHPAPATIDEFDLDPEWQAELDWRRCHHENHHKSREVTPEEMIQDIKVHGGSNDSDDCWLGQLADMIQDIKVHGGSNLYGPRDSQHDPSETHDYTPGHLNLTKVRSEVESSPGEVIDDIIGWHPQHGYVCSEEIPTLRERRRKVKVTGLRGKTITPILKLRAIDLSGVNPDMDPKLYEQILETRRKEARDKKTRLILRDGTVEDYTRGRKCIKKCIKSCSEAGITPVSEATIDLIGMSQEEHDQVVEEKRRKANLSKCKLVLRDGTIEDYSAKMFEASLVCPVRDTKKDTTLDWRE